MDTQPITPERLAASVIAVPPLARDADGALNPDANRSIIQHLENGGVSTLLYGGNANLYHSQPSEYPALLAMLESLAGRDTLVIPAIGPAYGVALDQAGMLRDTAFPTAMVLPHVGMLTMDGAERGLRRIAEALGKPIVVYVKNEGYLEPRHVKRLVDSGLVSWIKYAIVRADPAHDDYLKELVDLVDPSLIVSGIGEQPAIIHMRDFGVVGFTSGCVCVQPKLSMDMLRAIQNGAFETAESIRQQFCPLEDERNAIQPIRVLHDAVAGAGIAPTGPLLPYFENLSTVDQERIAETAKALRALTS